MSVDYRQPEDDLDYLLAAEDAQSDDETDVLGANGFVRGNCVSGADIPLDLVHRREGSSFM